MRESLAAKIKNNREENIHTKLFHFFANVSIYVQYLKIEFWIKYKENFKKGLILVHKL